MLRILQISPTFFSNSSILGGGERYPAELAKALTPESEVTLISFSDKSERTTLGGVPLHIYQSLRLRKSILNPFDLQFLSEIPSVDIVHAHQINTMVTDLACLMSRLGRKKMFLTDHGGGGEVLLNKRFPWVQDRATVILQSEFTRAFLTPRHQKSAVVIKGGVDTQRYTPNPGLPKDGSLLYVGRILPHKGINYLIEAFRLLGRQDWQLRIVGRVHDERYFQQLQAAAGSLRVEFIHQASDEEVRRYYQQAQVLILPSVHIDMNGNYHAAPELMGFTLLEAQSCGTPVICTRAGAMSEFVRDGVTGTVVEPNSAPEICEAIRLMLERSHSRQAEMSEACRSWADMHSWNKVAEEHLKLYRQA